MSQDVAVIVVTYNSAHVIDDLLDSLVPAAAGVSIRTVVVDNGSTDSTIERLSRRAGVQLVRSTNVGYSGGINLGVKAAGPTSAVLVLNPDTVLHPGSVQAMLASIQTPGTGIVVPQVLGPDGVPHRSLRREPSLLRAVGLGSTGLAIFAEYVDAPEEYVSSHVVDWAVGAALLISHECYEAVGGWDESYFLYSEETDFALRARDLGFATRFEPTATVTHIGGQSGRNASTHTMQVINRVRLYRRRHGVLSSWAYFLATIIGELSWAPREGRTHLDAVHALLRPSLRPPELGCSDRLMPT